jgi:methylmalonyl-CoA mutase cobalamin-binding subunit
MPVTQTYRIVYTGTAPFAGWVAQTLREEGLDVSWTPPVEERGAVSDVVENVTVALIVSGTTAAVRGAVAQARELLRGHGTVEIEDDQDDQDDQKM